MRSSLAADQESAALEWEPSAMMLAERALRCTKEKSSLGKAKRRRMQRESVPLESPGRMERVKQVQHVVTQAAGQYKAEDEHSQAPQHDRAPVVRTTKHSNTLSKKRQEAWWKSFTASQHLTDKAERTEPSWLEIDKNM